MEPGRANYPPPDWVPDWLPTPAPFELATRAPPPAPSSTTLISSSGDTQDPPRSNGSASHGQDAGGSFVERPRVEILVKPEPDRTVKRSLKGIHLFVGEPAPLSGRNRRDNTRTDDHDQRDTGDGPVLAERPDPRARRAPGGAPLLRPRRPAGVGRHAVRHGAAVHLAGPRRAVRLRQHLC